MTNLSYTPQRTEVCKNCSVVSEMTNISLFPIRPNLVTLVCMFRLVLQLWIRPSWRWPQYYCLKIGLSFFLHFLHPLSHFLSCHVMFYFLTSQTIECLKKPPINCQHTAKHNKEATSIMGFNIFYKPVKLKSKITEIVLLECATKSSAQSNFQENISFGYRLE